MLRIRKFGGLFEYTNLNLMEIRKEIINIIILAFMNF